MKAILNEAHHVIDEGKEWFILNIAVKLSKENYMKLLETEKNKEIEIKFVKERGDTNGSAK